MPLEPGQPRYLRNPPDIKMQQEVCRYFRERPELQDLAAEFIALSAYLSPPFWMESSAIKIKPFGAIDCGSHLVKKLTGDADTVFVPGCGISTLLMISEYLKTEAYKEKASFVLCDTHPFVQAVASRFCRYVADKRLMFEPASMEEVKLPESTSIVLLSFVEAAGEAAIKGIFNNLPGDREIRAYAISGKARNEYSGLTAEGVSELFMKAGWRVSKAEEIPSYSTHFRENGKCVDFLDLTEAQAHYLIMTNLRGGPPPNTMSQMHRFFRTPSTSETPGKVSA
jgi:hypothetical protein